MKNYQPKLSSFKMVDDVAHKIVILLLLTLPMLKLILFKAQGCKDF